MENSGICSRECVGGSSQARCLPDGQERPWVSRRSRVCVRVCVGRGSGTGVEVSIEEVPEMLSHD